MKNLLILMAIVPFVFSASAQSFASELRLGIDYFNTFNKSNSQNFQELEEREEIIGFKLSTNIHNNLDFGLSLDLFNLSDNFRLLQRTYFYGAFVSYEFLPPARRFNFGVAIAAKVSKVRLRNEYPYYEDANWSWYGGIDNKIRYRPFQKFKNMDVYAGALFSFPMFRHSVWSNKQGDYANLNYPYLGVSYTISNSAY